ncbi:MAG: archease [Candidatus Hydrogenedentes bacterium]|nr:archease [Candidatus Hydrogenedentota bacterium]
MKVCDAIFETIDHTADIGYICRGSSRAILFENCAVALLSLMFGVVDAVHSQSERKLEISADDPTELLVHFLNELLFLWETEHVVPTEVIVSEITSTHMVAMITEEPYEPDKHTVILDIKSATYHRLRIDKIGDYWEAEVVLDV